MAGEKTADLLKQLRAEAEAALQEGPNAQIKERLETILKMVNEDLDPVKH
jgi:hypothetical protein